MNKQPQTDNPIRKNYDTWTKNISEKAARFAEDLAMVFTPNDISHKNTPMQSQISNFLSETHQLD